MDRDKYNMVVEACALKSDLDMLPGGDMTEIGEKVKSHDLFCSCFLYLFMQSMT